MASPSTNLPGIDSDRNALRVACVSGGVCAVLIVVASVYLMNHLDQRLVLTTLSVFSDWRALRSIFMGAASYDPRFNLPALDYYSDFQTGVTSLHVLQDLYWRKLITPEVYANASKLFNLTTGARLVGYVDPARLMQLYSAYIALFNGSSAGVAFPSQIVTAAADFQDQRILTRLMSASGCSYPDAMPGYTPWNRSPGCHCIGSVYISFINATRKTPANVSEGARNTAAGDVLRCMDRRVTSHSWVAGEDFTVHPVAIALYLNCVVFLVCLAFILTVQAARPSDALSSPVWRFRVVEAMLVLTTGAFALLFVVHDFVANIFLVLGLCLTLGSLLFNAQSTLYQYVETAGERSPARCLAHPLLVCFWLNVPQIIPAVVALVAVSGYTRDVYAVWVVAGVGAIMGSLLQVLFFSPPFFLVCANNLAPCVSQRLFWILWFGYDSVMSLVVPPLLFAFFDLTVLLVLLLLEYRSDGGVYAMSGALAIIGFFLYVLALLGLLRYEYHVHRVRKERGLVMDQLFDNDRHSPVFMVTVATLVWMTVVGIVDVQR